MQHWLIRYHHIQEHFSSQFLYTIGRLSAFHGSVELAMAIDNYIRDTQKSSVIPFDEPVFLLRSTDPLLMPVLIHYRELCKRTDLDPLTIARLEAFIETVRNYQSRRIENAQPLAPEGS